MNKPQTIRRSYTAYIDLDDTIDNVINNLEKIRSECPEEFRDSLSLSVDSDYNSSGLEISFYYFGPKTEEELNFEKEISAKIKEVRRRQFEALKKEFGEEITT